MESQGKDRKYKLALLSLVLCTGCYIGTAFNDKMAENFGTFVMALGMVLGLYGGANIGHKYVVAKHGDKTPADEEEIAPQP